jgi:hypothetical protein
MSTARGFFEAVSTARCPVHRRRQRGRVRLIDAALWPNTTPRDRGRRFENDVYDMLIAFFRRKMSLLMHYSYGSCIARGASLACSIEK